MTDINQLKQKSEELVRQQQELAQQIKDLEAKEQEEPKPWEPWPRGVSHDGYHIFSTLRKVEWTTNCNQQSLKQYAGLCYPTKDQATKAQENIIFFARLLALATELNATHGSTGYTYNLRYHKGKWECSHYQEPTRPFVDNLFTSNAAAQEACDIMNRDGWKMPCEV